MTPGVLTQQLTEAEFAEMQVYASRRMLPMRRIEMYLAQIAMMIAKVNGSKCELSDFLFDPVDTAAPMTEDDEIEFFGFNPAKGM